MASRRPGDKQSSEPMMAYFIDIIYTLIGLSELRTLM